MPIKLFVYSSFILISCQWHISKAFLVCWIYINYWQQFAFILLHAKLQELLIRLLHLLYLICLKCQFYNQHIIFFRPYQNCSTLDALGICSKSFFFFFPLCKTHISCYLVRVQIIYFHNYPWGIIICYIMDGPFLNMYTSICNILITTNWGGVSLGVTTKTSLISSFFS